jgi:site-specific DNA-methyltransferase (adenine-specific)
VLDPFAGSGTTGEAALALGRRFVLIDSSEQAVEVMAKRFASRDDVAFVRQKASRPATAGR